MDRLYTPPKLKPLQESKHCFECGAVFNLFKQKYHCRNCGNVVCSTCSNHKYMLKKFGYENPVRCCNTCDKFIKMQTMSYNDLIKLSSKALKDYIQIYQLPAKPFIEKNDLVKTIMTTTISNENECHYRFNRSNQQQSAKRNNQSQQQWQEQWQRQQQQLYQERYGNTQQQVPRQPQQQRSSPQKPSISKSKPVSNTEIPLLQDLIREKIDPSTLSVRVLKSILKANFVEQSHVIEKAELVKLVQRLIEGEKQGSELNDDSLCRVCCDAQQNCVFLDCGHMVTCMDCAKKLIQTKNECPICREPILKLVHVFRS